MKPAYKITSVLGMFLIVFMSCSDGLEKREIQKNGKIVKQWFEKKLDNGMVVKHGTYTEWHRNGQKALEVNMVHGKENGKKIRWYAGGQKKYEGMMADGKGDGRWIKYYSNGQAWIQSDWDNGNFLGKTVMWSSDGNTKKFFHFPNRNIDFQIRIKGYTCGTW
jgi:antitoxin component YwqK of YwqJK toxin-antitoxin module